MKKTKAILIAAVVCMMASVCWGQSYWKRTCGEGGNENYVNAIASTTDGNFILTGGTKSFSAGSYNGYILKITPYGDTLWTKTYGDAGSGYFITPTSDGNFILFVGNEIQKITPNGDILWTKTYGGTNIDWAYAITPTSDGNFILAGNEIQKITPYGDTLWTKTYGNGGTVFSITPMSDGNFIASGYTNSFDPTYEDVYLMKITAYGDMLWTKTYGGALRDIAYAITPTPDGNFIVAGFTGNSGGENENVYLLKIKPDGDTLWTKRFGGAESYKAYTITPTPDGNIIVVGYSSGNEGAVYLLKITLDGDTLWTKRYMGTEDRAVAITSTPDGNFIVAGNGGTINGYMWLLSIIDDRYAKKDSLFTFKIPVSGDSLNHGYSPLKVPTGMTVSLGGTISWTPKTDSVYMDHSEFLVFDDNGNKDTLTFNIFVSSSYKPTAIKSLSRTSLNKNQSFSIMQTSSSQIKFTLPLGVSNIDIYDINGRCVQRIKPLGAQAVWNGLNAAGSPVSSGRYFAKIKEGKTSRMGQFTVVK